MACFALLYMELRRASQELELRSEVKGQRWTFLKINNYFNKQKSRKFRSQLINPDAPQLTGRC